MTIPYSRPLLGPREEEAVLAVMRSGWLTTGKEALAFEAEFAELLSSAEPGTETQAQPAERQNSGSAENAETDSNGGFKCLALSSATAGLHLGIAALDMPENSRVLLPSYSFASSANAVLYNRLIPLFVDSLPGAYHMDPAGVQAALEKNGSLKTGGRIGALLPVHFGGVEIAGRRLRELADKYGMRIVEDAAHSFPGRSAAGGYQGASGDVGIYSFYANKTITTGEGGMLVTQNPQLAATVKKLRLLGISREIWSRYQDNHSSYEYDIVLPGYKYNMPDILAAIGRVQLSRAGEFASARRIIAGRYWHAFAGRDWIAPPPLPGEKTGEFPGSSLEHSWHIYSLMLNTEKLNISRDDFINRLAQAGISTSVHFIPLHTMTYYRQKFGLSPSDCPNALKSSRRSISLPIFPSLSMEEQSHIIDEVLKIGDTQYKG